MYYSGYGCLVTVLYNCFGLNILFLDLVVMGWEELRDVETLQEEWSLLTYITLT